MEEGPPTAQHQTPGADTAAKSAAPVHLVRPSPRMRQIIEELVNFARPSTGKEFYARYGTHVSLVMIALFGGCPSSAAETDSFSLSVLEDLRAYSESV